jgi:NitT/TauT family transport system permease protein
MKAGLRISSVATGMGMFLLLWQVLAWVVARPILPPPTVVLPLFVRLMGADLGLHLAASAARVTVSVLLAILAAVPLGLGLGQMRAIDRVVAPLVAIVYPIPKIVFLPVIYVALGITEISKVFLIFLVLFFQVLVLVRDEAANLPPELLLSVRSLGAGRRALFRFVYLPASVPVALTALRLSAGTAVAVLFIAEQSLTTRGLGYYIVVETYQVLRYPEMYAGILAMSLLGLGFYFLVSTLEQKVTRYLRP